MTLEFPSRFQLRLGKESDRTVGKHFQAVVVMLAVTGVLFGAVGTRLAQLQLVEGPLNRQRADTNRIRLVPKRPARGLCSIVMARFSPVADCPTRFPSGRSPCPSLSGLR